MINREVYDYVGRKIKKGHGKLIWNRETTYKYFATGEFEIVASNRIERAL